MVLRAEANWEDGLWRPRSALEGMPSVFLKAAREALLAPSL
jgi:hypothetical protein